MQPFLAARDEAVRVQDAQMLRRIRLTEARGIHEFIHAHLAAAQRVQDAQTGGLAERLEALGDQVDQWTVELLGSHEPPFVTVVTSPRPVPVPARSDCLPTPTPDSRPSR